MWITLLTRLCCTAILSNLGPYADDYAFYEGHLLHHVLGYIRTMAMDEDLRSCGWFPDSGLLRSIERILVRCDHPISTRDVGLTSIQKRLKAQSRDLTSSVMRRTRIRPLHFGPTDRRCFQITDAHTSQNRCHSHLHERYTVRISYPIHQFHQTYFWKGMLKLAA